jgi:hypothetical protein
MSSIVYQEATAKGSTSIDVLTEVTEVTACPHHRPNLGHVLDKKGYNHPWHFQPNRGHLELPKWRYFR